MLDIGLELILQLALIIIACSSLGICLAGLIRHGFAWELVWGTVQCLSILIVVDWVLFSS